MVDRGADRRIAEARPAYRQYGGTPLSPLSGDRHRRNSVAARWLETTLTHLKDHFAELVRYRALIESLVWREVRARYRGSMLGFLWTLLNPLLLLLVYSLVFTKVTRAVDIPNYAVFFFVGILPWLWLSTSVSAGSVAISQGGNLITRVCMPPQVLPAVTVLSNLVNLLLALPVALLAAAWFEVYPTWALIALPIVLLNQLAFCYGVALLLSTLTVRFRDVQFLVQNLITFWFFLTPIAYPYHAVPGQFRILIMANPATAIILPYQQTIYYRIFPSPVYLALGAGWSAVLLLLALVVFEASRDTLAEEI